MKILILPFRVVARGVWRIVLLIHEGEADIRETYPDQAKPTGQQAAVSGSLFSGMVGVGHS